MSNATLLGKTAFCAAALLAACGGPQWSIGTAGAPAPAWMASGAKERDLLYISDGGANTVDVYAYRARTLVAKLTGLADPAGECSDSAGNVWIVNSASSKIAEYARGSKKREALLSDYGASNLVGCSVDPVTGNLAVTDLGGPIGGGGVWIYTQAKGTPKEHTDSAIAYAYYCGYDDAGNLFVDGLDSNRAFSFAELPRGRSAFRNIALNQHVGFPGGVQWDGKYVAVGDQTYDGRHTSAIYQVSVSVSVGTVEHTTPLLESCDVLQFAIASLASDKRKLPRRLVIAPDVCKSDVKVYEYPAGGAPTRTFTGFQYPAGAAFSPAL
jgi:hypothetical protein